MPNTEEILIEAGLEPTETEIYLILAKNGELTVPGILEHTTLSRASVYDALSELLVKEYVEYRKEGRNAYYKPVHPSKLYSLIEQKKRDVALLEGELGETVRSLTGSYNLANNKPGVRFFDDKEGFEEALNDSLSATETIYTFVNLDDVKKYADDVNKAYVAKRQKKGIQKKILLLDTPGDRDYIKAQGEEATDARFLPKELVPFRTGMQIYNNKISYFTLREKNIVAIIIEDPDIYQMHRNIFEFLWNLVDKKTAKRPQEDVKNEPDHKEQVAVFNT
jgi:sugar-specific transcriptional regulator TrmB